MTPLPLALALLLAADPVAEPPPSPPASARGEPGAAPRAEPPPTPPEPPPAAPVEAAPDAPALPPPAPPGRIAPPAPPAPEGAPPPAASPAPPDEPPDLTQPGGATPYRTPFGTGTPAPAAHDERAGPAEARVPAPARSFVREYAIQAGPSAASLAGLGATGYEGRFAFSVPTTLGFRGTGLVAVDLFFGETDVGLQIRSLGLAAEGWIEPASRLRLGAGAGLGLVGYQRATSGEWPVMLAVGLRAGAELAPLRWRNGAVVIGVHLAGYVEEEFWGTASLRVGLRFGGARAQAPEGPEAGVEGR